MMKLADLKDMSDAEVLDHIAGNYAGGESGFAYGQPSMAEKSALRERLNTITVLIAYESVGDYGCDSSAFFLVRLSDGSLAQVNASHCSCYGFEGQWDETEVLPQALKETDFTRVLGGYDEDGEKNAASIKAFVEENLRCPTSATC